MDSLSWYQLQKKDFHILHPKFIGWDTKNSSIHEEEHETYPLNDPGIDGELFPHPKSGFDVYNDDLNRKITANGIGVLEMYFNKHSVDTLIKEKSPHISVFEDRYIVREMYINSEKDGLVDDYDYRIVIFDSFLMNFLLLNRHDITILLHSIDTTQQQLTHMSVKLWQICCRCRPKCYVIFKANGLDPPGIGSLNQGYPASRQIYVTKNTLYGLTYLFSRYLKEYKCLCTVCKNL